MSTLQLLLVDDDEATNAYHQIILKRSSLVADLHCATDGEAALTYLTTPRADGTTYPCPDIIFLDINMPRMDGFEFLEAYKDLPDEQKGRCVVVMLTTSLLPSDRKRAESNPYVVDFLDKPLKLDTFMDLVRQYL